MKGCEKTEELRNFNVGEVYNIQRDVTKTQ